MPAISGTDKQKYLTNLREGDTHAVAAKNSGHPRTSYARIAEKDEAFRKAITEATAVGLDTLEQELVDVGRGKVEVKMPRLVAIFAVLKKRDPDKWVEKNQIAVGNADNKPLEVSIGIDIREIIKVARSVGAGFTEGDAGHRSGVPGTGEVLPVGDKGTGSVGSASGLPSS